MAGREPVPDLGIDTTPRDPVRLSTRRRPMVASSRALSWSRAFWGGVWSLVTLAASAFAWVFLEDAFRPPADRDVPAVARALEGRRVQEPPDSFDVAERERIDAQAEADAYEAEIEAEVADGRSRDRRLWAKATPEVMALAWARRARPGSYRVVSARKLMFVLIAILEETRTGQTYGLRADMDPGSNDAELRLTEIRPR